MLIDGNAFYIQNNNKSVPKKRTLIFKTVKWLRADKVDNKISFVFIRALAFLLSALLVVSIVGIPLLLTGVIEWKNQQFKEKHDNFPASKDDPIMNLSYQSILKKHDEYKRQPLLLRPSPFDPTNPPWKTMEGISLIADHLCKKNGISHLSVCHTLDAFKRKLEEINISSNDTRLALIVPSYQPIVTCIQKKCSRSDHKTPDFHSQHKVAVFIEKKDGKMKLCVMDSACNSKLRQEKTFLDNGNNFSCHELVHAYIRAANLSNATYYYTIIKRHFSPRGGCSTFALRDAMGFLRDTNFFGQIDVKGEIDRNTGLGSIDSPYYAQNLPPEFMKTAQSFTVLNAYKTKNAFSQGLFDLRKPLGKHQRTLDESLKKHTRVVNNKGHNKHIDDRIKKYQVLILQYMFSLSSIELSNKVKKRLFV